MSNQRQELYQQRIDVLVEAIRKHQQSVYRKLPTWEPERHCIEDRTLWKVISPANETGEKS